MAGGAGFRAPRSGEDRSLVFFGRRHSQFQFAAEVDMMQQFVTQQQANLR